MAQPNQITGDQRQRLSDQYETLLRSLIMLRGDSVSPAKIGQIVERATATATPAEERDPVPSTAAIGRLQQFLVEATAPDAAPRPVNLYSAEGVRAAEATGGRSLVLPETKDAEAVRFARQHRENRSDGDAGGGTDRSASGARFDGMGAMDWGSPAGLARMRDYAVQAGLSWAAGNTELLRLGPAAIQTLADVHLKRETFKQLTTDASFKAKDVVTLARFAKEQHLDANALGQKVTDAEKVLTPEERAKFNNAVVPYMADAKDPERRAKANKAFDDAEKAHPEHREKFEALRETIKLKEEKLDKTVKAANGKEVEAEAKGTRAEAKGTKAEAKDAKAEAKGIVADAKADAFNSRDDGPTPSEHGKTKPGTIPSGPQPTRAASLKGDAAKPALPKL